MRNVNISGLEITINNALQIINMGGPYIGTISLGNRIIAEDCILDNFLYRDDLKKLFFVKYHVVNHEWCFTINFFSIDENQEFEFTRIIKMVYLKQFLSANELEFFNAFHDKNPERRDVFDINKEPFRKV